MRRLSGLLLTAAAAGLVSAPSGAATYNSLYAMPGTNDGAGPQGGFIDVGGVLYGATTYGGATGNGTLVKLDPATGAVTKLYDFAGGADGFFPPASLLNVGGLLYGVTQYGGAHGQGTIFTYDPATAREAVVWSFGGSEGLVPSCTLIAAGGNLYGTAMYGGASGNGTVFKLVVSSGTVTAVYSFAGGTDALSPAAGLVESGGTLYGTSQYGGSNGAGAIYAVLPATGVEKLVYSFGSGTDAAYPYAPLTAVNGVLYGTGQSGGSNGAGAVFSFDPGSARESVLHSFSAATEGENPVAGLAASKNVLYGATYYGGPGTGGALYSLSLSGGTFSVLHAFGLADGADPFAAPLLVGDVLYGVTEYGGNIVNGAAYALSLDSGTEKVLHSFTGGTPLNSLGLDILQGTIYALSGYGGATGAGAVAAISPTSGKAKLLDSLSTSGGFGPDGYLTADTALYGVSAFGGNSGCGGLGCGTVFKIAPATGAQTQVLAFPADAYSLCSVGDLLNVGGTLYGTRCEGGTNGTGTIFKVDPKTGVQTTLYSFAGGSDGAVPFAPLISIGSSLYGTTAGGGSNNAGTLFKLSLTTMSETVLYSFSGSRKVPGDGDAAEPYSRLTDVRGTLYGTSFWGGAYGWGTVYAFDLATGTEKVLHSFQPNGIDGTQPGGGLSYMSGLLYGMTVYGGSGGAGCDYNSCGTVFSVNPASGAESILHSFTGGPDGGNPPFGAQLVTGTGILYGSTGSAGAHGLGTVFSLQP